jgi:hypothetical protein
MAVPSAKPWTPWSYGRAPHPGGTWSPLAGPSRETTYLLKHLTVNGCLGGKEEEGATVLLSSETAPDRYTWEMFTMVMVYFCLYWLVVADLRTFMALGLPSRKDDSLLNNVFS